MNFRHTEHTLKYFNKCKKLSNKLINYDWNNEKGFGIELSKDEDNLKYLFLKLSSKNFTKIQDTKQSELNQFLNDPNILSVGIIKMSAKSEVQMHKDHDYWSAPFHRVHIPINSPGAYFIYGNEKIVWETDEVYIFNVMSILHGAKNETDEEYQMIYVDISQEEQVKEQKRNKHLNKLAKEYQEKFLETVSSDLIISEHKNNCTEEELRAEKEYLDQYNRNLEIG